jgi:hypothetical protein
MLLAGTLLAAPPAAASPVVQKTVERDPSAVERSWSKADFRAARPRVPVPGPGPSPGPAPGPGAVPEAGISAAEGPFYPTDVFRLPYSRHGKVFFRMGLSIFECSATLIESRAATSIFTAGHCVYDPATLRWAEDLVFVPGYENRSEPYGRYAAVSLQTTRSWAGNPPVGDPGGYDYSEDIGVATLAGTPVADVGGAAKIAFNLDPGGRRYTIYGYPGEPSPPYDGERLVGCRARVVIRDQGNPNPLGATPCDIGHGASGGAWMTGGYLNSVMSYVYCPDVPEYCNYVFGPYFSRAAKALYKSAPVGGAIRPAIRVKRGPSRVVRKRKVVFRFASRASTPIRYRCRFDRRAFQRCGARTSISRLTPGRHVLRARAVDQTGQKSRTIVRKFRVKPRR